MKNAVDSMKDVKKKIDYQIGKQFFMLIIWLVVALVVRFQPESTLKTWVFMISVLAIMRRIFMFGLHIGREESLNALIEGCSSKADLLGRQTTTVQEIGNAGSRVKSESKRGAKE